MMETLRYIGLSLALGGLTVWASENLFWMMPPADLTLLGLGMTVVAYAIAASAALSVVIWAGLGGLPAAFLGGAILGYLVEGVVVGTIYDPLPFFLVWTPLAWHALITGGLILGLARAGLPVLQMAAIWVALGLGGAFWAQYWVSEHPAPPTTSSFALYILGCSLVVPLTHMLIDRMGRLPNPPRPVLWITPALAALIWVAQGVAEVNPYRLILPVILAGLIWVMRRLGTRPPVAGVIGKTAPLAYHLLFLIAPALIVALAPLGWAQGWGTLSSNVVVATVTCLLSLVLLGKLAVRAYRTP